MGGTGGCVGGARGGGGGGLTVRIFGTLAELIIASNIGGPRNEVVQAIIGAEALDERSADLIVEPAKVMVSGPGVVYIRFVFELGNEHFKFC